jgi:hypothetical protein
MFDPISFWMQGTVFWMKMFKQQQEAYLRMLGAFAEKLPQENAATLAREAEAVKAALTPANKPVKPAVVKKPAVEAAVVTA